MGMARLVLCLFFFFQAEDGIRDWSVTGVQTCALPISTRSACSAPPRPMAESTAIPAATAAPAPRTDRGIVALATALRPSLPSHPRRPLRSEERRVGKEGRCRRSAYD